nr:MAG TPA: hypothetical protein [Bacteriophage sp.]
MKKNLISCIIALACSHVFVLLSGGNMSRYEEASMFCLAYLCVNQILS